MDHMVQSGRFYLINFNRTRCSRFVSSPIERDGSNLPPPLPPTRIREMKIMVIAFFFPPLKLKIGMMDGNPCQTETVTNNNNKINLYSIPFSQSKRTKSVAVLTEPKHDFSPHCDCLLLFLSFVSSFFSFLFISFLFFYVWNGWCDEVTDWVWSESVRNRRIRSGQWFLQQCDAGDDGKISDVVSKLASNMSRLFATRSLPLPSAAVQYRSNRIDLIGFVKSSLISPNESRDRRRAWTDSRLFFFLPARRERVWEIRPPERSWQLSHPRPKWRQLLLFLYLPSSAT